MIVFKPKFTKRKWWRRLFWAPWRSHDMVVYVDIETRSPLEIFGKYPDRPDYVSPDGMAHELKIDGKRPDLGQAEMYRQGAILHSRRK